MSDSIRDFIYEIEELKLTLQCKEQAFKSLEALCAMIERGEVNSVEGVRIIREILSR